MSVGSAMPPVTGFRELLVVTLDRLGCVAGFPMRPASKASRHCLPVRRDRRRGLHLADVP